MKQLLIVAHQPSPNTHQMALSIEAGAKNEAITEVDVLLLPPFDTLPTHVLTADAMILMTTENLGYMSGALKDFFDRVYYPCLELSQGKPYALCVRAGHDGTGTQRAVKTIVTGLKWREAHAPLVCRGEWQTDFLDQCEELGMYMAASLEAGII